MKKIIQRFSHSNKFTAEEIKVMVTSGLLVEGNAKKAYRANSSGGYYDKAGGKIRWNER